MSAPNPASSNTVLFEMTMWYKARLESAEAEGRLMQQRLADQQEQIHQLIANNNLLTQANQRGANLITMKHEAGTMFDKSRIVLPTCSELCDARYQR